MKFLHDATIITAEKEAVGSILVKDGKIDTIIRGGFVPRRSSIMEF